MERHGREVVTWPVHAALAGRGPSVSVRCPPSVGPSALHSALHRFGRSSRCPESCNPVFWSRDLDGRVGGEKGQERRMAMPRCYGTQTLYELKPIPYRKKKPIFVGELKVCVRTLKKKITYHKHNDMRT